MSASPAAREGAARAQNNSHEPALTTLARWIAAAKAGTFARVRVQTVAWTPTWGLRILDQTALPSREVYVDLETADDVADAIRRLRVRGAPAIGVAAAMGLVAALRGHRGEGREAFVSAAERVAAELRATRPTAVNLGWALDRMLGAARAPAGPGAALWERLRDEAQAIWQEDRDMCRRIGEAGLPLVPPGGAVLTHCNTGALATGGIGTALAPVYLAHGRGTAVSVYVGETRPLGQGARLTAWELRRSGVPCTVIVDAAAGAVFRDARIDVVLVGADRIARNGDTANKIGTYGLAVLAKHHNVPFYVCAPTSTLDSTVESGGAIPIEQRAPDEVPHPAGVAVYNPAFDVTPARYVSGYVTDRGILRPPFGD